MTYSTKLKSAVCGAALVAGGTAQADVTAAQVWENWKSQMSIYGDNTVSIGSEDQSGDTLTISDFSFSFADGEGQANVDFGDIVFTEQGDGSVSVAMEDSFPVVFSDDYGLEARLEIAQTAFEMVVSGDPDAMNYAISADSYSIKLVEIVNDDVTLKGDVQFVANDLSSVYNVQTGDLRDVEYEGSIGSMDLLVDIEIPNSDGEYITGGGKMEGLTMQGQAVVPLELDLEDPDTIFADGLSFSGGYVIENSAYVFDVNAEGDQASGSFSGGQTTLDMEFSSEKVAYTTNIEDLAVSISASELPFPVEIGLSEYGIGVEMPMAKSDTVKDFGLNFDLVDLTVNDVVWNLIDPGSVLSRDPATIQFAISGLAKPLIDLMNPEDALFASDMPFELESVTLDRLQLAAVGVLLTGQGEFTFDSTDMTSFAPLPKPEGDIIVEASGLNALMDNLVSMGLIADADLTAPRIMMGAFARSTGDDRLESKLEITEDGQVLANGQRIR